MGKQQPRRGKRRTASAGAASVKGRPQHSHHPVPAASHLWWWAGLRSPCAAAHAERAWGWPDWRAVFAASEPGVAPTALELTMHSAHRSVAWRASVDGLA